MPDNNQYRKTPRAGFIDYENGCYFITICTGDRKHYFGEIEDGEMKYTPLGLYCRNELQNAQLYYEKRIEILLFTVMPNHIHAIIKVNGDSISAADLQQRIPNPSLRANPASRRHVPLLSRYINSFKGSVSKYAKSQNLEFCWQSRFHDHLIRNEREGINITEYIINNVSNWDKDTFHKM